jgi:glycosyltransferase involved in cell wall biosynthesis
MLFPHPLPKNVTVIEQLPHKDLIDFFKKASIYCQLSRVEIFGVAIGEAMQYRCIPIVTNVGGMPEVVGSNGFVVPRDIEKIAEIIYDLDRQETAERREACSQQILTHFSFAQRQDLLLSTIERIMG